MHAKTSSTSQSMSKGCIGLPAYLQTLIMHFDLTDLSSSTEEQSADTNKQQEVTGRARQLAPSKYHQGQSS
jgi:hypothetical protein